MCADKIYRYLLVSAFLCLQSLNLLASFFVNEDWSTYVGGQYGNDCVKASAIDSDYNGYFGGYLGDGGIIKDGGAYYPTPPYTYIGAKDGFVSEVNTNGVLQWYVCLGEGEDDEVRGIAEYGDSVFAAAWQNRTDSSDNGGTDAHIYKLSKDDGAGSSIYTLGAVDATNAFNAVTVDTNGNIYAVGYTSIDGLTISVPGYQVGGTTYGTSLQGDRDAVVVKMSPSGAPIWIHYLGGENYDSALTCTIGTNGFLYVGGETESSGWVAFPGIVVPSASHKAGFVVKLSSNGDHIWSTFIGGSGDDSVAALAFESVSGHLFAAGSTSSYDFMGDGALDSNDGDGFVTSITDNGTSFAVNWSQLYGSTGDDSITSIQQLDDSQMVIGGSTPTAGWLPEADNDHNGGMDGFIIAFDPGGTSLWSHYVGGSDKDETLTLAAESGVFYAGGLTFSDDNWVSGGFHDVWDKDDPWGDGGVEQFGFAVKFTSLGYLPDMPEITTQPLSRSVEEQQDADFSIEAISAESISYQWYLNSSLITDATNITLTLASVTLAQDGDQITCIVSNLAGAVTSASAILTVTAIPMGWIKIDLTPAAAVSNDVAWSIDGGTNWLASAEATNVLTGEYTIKYKEVFGWAAPTNPVSTTVTNQLTNSLSATFTEIFYPVVRTITGTNVVITVTPPAGTSYWVLTENIPSGLTPYDYPTDPTDPWNGSATNFVYFQLGGSPAQFSYSVTGTVGDHSVSGSVNFVSVNFVSTTELTEGADTITIASDEPPQGVPNPDITEFYPDSGIPGNWWLTFVSIVGQNYLIETNGTPASIGWAQQGAAVAGQADQTTTSVSSSEESLFFRVNTPIIP